MQLSHNKGSISKACQKMDLKKKKNRRWTLNTWQGQQDSHEHGKELHKVRAYNGNPNVIIVAYT